MRYLVIALFAYITAVAQPIFYFEDAVLKDFSNVQRTVVAALSNDSVIAFQRFIVERTLDTLIDFGTGKTEKRVYLYCKDYEGKTYRFRVIGGSNVLQFYSAKSFEDCIKKLRKEQFVFFEKDNLINKFKAWNNYKFEDAYYDEKTKRAIIKLTFGNQSFLIDEVEFSGDYFISSAKYNETLKLYGQKFGREIIREEISLGMTPEMVLASWGAPKTQAEYISATGNIITYNYKYNVLTFYNGKLQSIYKHE